MASILFLGFFIGMHHTLEADHVAAVASISSDESSVRRIVKHGVVWGLGHTLTLLVFGGGSVMLGAAMPETLAHGLETAVGVMLIFLGKSRKDSSAITQSAPFPERQSDWRV